jgi:uncharacterized membrane protein YdjX (TVP38/TMEM64 family)
VTSDTPGVTATQGRTNGPETGTCNPELISVKAQPAGTPPAPEDQGPPPRPKFIHRHGELLLTVAGLLVVAAMFVVIPSLRHAFSLSIHGNLSGLRDYIRSLHFGGLVLLFALMLLHAVIPYPTEILTTTSGYIYGFIPGMLLALLGWTCSAVLSYGLGWTIGRPLLRAILGTRFSRLERAVNRGGAQLMISARLVPVVPLSLLGYVAGATRRGLWLLTWTTFVGIIPITAATALLGSQAKSFSANNPLVWIAAAVVIGLLVASRFIAKRATPAPPAG